MLTIADLGEEKQIFRGIVSFSALGGALLVCPGEHVPKGEAQGLLRPLTRDNMSLSCLAKVGKNSFEIFGALVMQRICI